MGFLCLFCALGTFAWADDVTTSVTLTNSDVVSCTFPDKATASDTEHFEFGGDITSSSSYGSVTITDAEGNEATYSHYLKFNSSGTITFTTTEANTDLTLVFGSTDETNMPFTIKVSIDGGEAEEVTVSANPFTYTCETVGTYKISEGSKEVHVFYVGLTKDVETVEAKTYEPVTVSDDIECWFTGGAPSNTNDFTITSTDNSRDIGYGTNGGNGSVVINSETIEDCLKLESITQISFTTTEDNTVLTLVFAETDSEPSLYIQKGEDGDKQEITSDTNVLTYICEEAGTYILSTKSGSHYIFYMGLSAGTPSGINSVSLQTTGNNVYYNLNGQRVSTPTHGVYILNGKKVLMK